MSATGRREFHERKIVRSVSPSKYHHSSHHNVSQFDSNLDNLLEDLQRSVACPEQSLSKCNSLSRITNVHSSSPVTEFITDDSYQSKSPDGRSKVSGFKKETYFKTTSSSTSPLPTSDTRVQRSINQLDSLLDDLKSAKHASNIEHQYRTTETDTKGSLVKKSVHRELQFDESHNNVGRRYHCTNEGNYGDICQIRAISPSPLKTTVLTNQISNHNLHTCHTGTVDSALDSEILAHIDPNLHPPNNTKVTTTIKTYTYELPGSAGPSYPAALEPSVTNTEAFSPNRTEFTTPSNSIVYHKITDNADADINLLRENNWKFVERECTTTDRKVYPAYESPPPVEETTLKETITTKSYRQDNNKSPTTQTYHYDETITHAEQDPKIATYANMSRDHPINLHYKFKSENRTTSNYRAGVSPKSEREPLLPKPFPVDNHDGKPPKKLDDLMASIGSEPPNNQYNAKFNAHEDEMQQRKKFENTSEINDMQRKEFPKTKNITGPPVYYPPGHNMFAKKEEQNGAWRAEGGYSRASGKYEYESKSKSKSKNSSGAAVIPVCLPCCCGVPCVIM